MFTLTMPILPSFGSSTQDRSEHTNTYASRPNRNGRRSNCCEPSERVPVLKMRLETEFLICSLLLLCLRSCVSFIAAAETLSSRSASKRPSASPTKRYSGPSVKRWNDADRQTIPSPIVGLEESEMLGIDITPASGCGDGATRSRSKTGSEAGAAERWTEGEEVVAGGGEAFDTTDIS